MKTMTSNQNKPILAKIGMLGIISLIALFLACGSAGAEPASASQVILIKIDPSVIAITDITSADNIVRDYTSELPGTYAIRVPAGEEQNSAVTMYSAIPGVIYAEPDFEVQIFTSSPTGTATAKPTTQATQKSPAPVAGLVLGLGAAALLIRMRR